MLFLRKPKEISKSCDKKEMSFLVSKIKIKKYRIQLERGESCHSRHKA